jgi:hypothetical protein
MKYKSITSVCAALSTFFAVAFISAPDVFTFNMFPNAEGLALEVGIVKRYMMAAMALMGAVMILGVHEVSDAKSQRSILLALGVGFTIPCATLIALVVSHSIPLQVVPVVATGFAATMCYRAVFRLETRDMVFSGHG